MQYMGFLFKRPLYVVGGNSGGIGHNKYMYMPYSFQ